MANVKSSFGSGGSGLTPNDSAGTPGLATVLRDGIDDTTELHTQLIALLVKLDADVGINDVNYESTLTPAALKNVKV